MDALEQLIRDEGAELDELRASLTALQITVAAKEAKVSALREAADLRPSTKAKRASGRGGKPRGAISAPWKNTLKEIYATGNAYYYEGVKTYYDHVNSGDLAIASVRDRVRAFVETGLMSGEAGDGFRVTDLAAKKFNFPEPKPVPPPLPPTVSNYDDLDADIPF